MSETDSLEHVLTDVRLDNFDLDERVRRGIGDAGFEYCTPIQARTLPLALAGCDVAGQARTGTGKTAAYLLTIFNCLLGSRGGNPGSNPRAIVVAPTRELAIQIHRDAELLGRHTGLRLALAYGGVDYEKQRTSIASGCDLLIGTPGRLIDYFKQRVYRLNDIRVAVLDEADRMFDLGFIKDIRFLFRNMPPVDKRQCLMFSATFPLKVTELAYEHMNDAEVIRFDEEQVVTERVTQRVYYPANREKPALLVKILRGIEDGHVMVFVNTRRAADLVGRILRGNGMDAEVLAGNVPQKRRQTLLDKFRSGKLPILVATDVAARGLHIPGVSHVINYDLPQEAADYVHRIGRTARLGKTGDAISFACEDYAFHLPDIEEFIGKSIPQIEHDPEELPRLERAVPPRKNTGASRGGRRPSRHSARRPPARGG